MKKIYHSPCACEIGLRGEAFLLAGSVIHEGTNPDVGDEEDYTRRQGVDWDAWADE